MTVYLTSAETENEVVLQWYSTEVGDVVENPAGQNYEHPTLAAFGKAQVEIEGQHPQEFEAPHIFILPLHVPYKFIVTEAPGVISCVYSKLTGAADEIRDLIKHGTLVWGS